MNFCLVIFIAAFLPACFLSWEINTSESVQWRGRSKGNAKLCACKTQRLWLFGDTTYSTANWRRGEKIWTVLPLGWQISDFALEQMATSLGKNKEIAKVGDICRAAEAVNKH